LWGLDVVTDQQIGGLIMKIPGSLAFFITMIFVFSLWYQRDNRGGYSPIIEMEPPEEDQ
jgi:cytochrome c oxidase assembly factor CtaG